MPTRSGAYFKQSYRWTISILLCFDVIHVSIHEVFVMEIHGRVTRVTTAEQ